MARLARAEQFSPDEIAIVHVYNRVVRRCFLMGYDPLTGKNYNYRRRWIEELIKKHACSGTAFAGGWLPPLTGPATGVSLVFCVVVQARWQEGSGII